MLVKNDFSAQLFIGELSFKRGEKEEEGKKKQGGLLHETRWQGEKNEQ